MQPPRTWWRLSSTATTARSSPTALRVRGKTFTMLGGKVRTAMLSLHCSVLMLSLQDCPGITYLTMEEICRKIYRRWMTKPARFTTRQYGISSLQRDGKLHRHSGSDDAPTREGRGESSLSSLSVRNSSCPPGNGPGPGTPPTLTRRARKSQIFIIFRAGTEAKTRTLDSCGDTGGSLYLA